MVRKRTNSEQAARRGDRPKTSLFAEAFRVGLRSNPISFRLERRPELGAHSHHPDCRPRRGQKTKTTHPTGYAVNDPPKQNKPSNQTQKSMQPQP